MDPQVQHRMEEMRSSLEGLGVSITRRRAKTLEALASTDRHPSVNDLHAEVRRWYPSTSLATIYNTIELLKEAGQVLELEFSGAANRYDGRRLDSHPHLICLDCRSIEDMSASDSYLDSKNDSLRRISTATGYKVVRDRTDYYGVCPECQEQDSEQKSFRLSAKQVHKSGN